MSKSVRWTIYVAITIGVLGFGYWLTYTQRPDTYMPRDAPDPSIFGDIAGGEDTDELSAANGEVRGEEGWVIELSGIVEGRTDLYSNDGEHFVGLQLAFEQIVELEGTPPSISSPVLALATKDLIEKELDEIPAIGTRITIESQGTEGEPFSVPIRSIEVRNIDP